jgi:hypothetical protein
MGVGDHECALMCALRAQTCAYYYTSSIGGQTAHLLEQWAYVMGVGGRECALMRALRVQHHTYRIGAQRAGPIEPQIGTKTHWGNGHKLLDRRARSSRSAQSGRCSRPARARSTTTRAKHESTGMEQGAATASSAKFECGARAARISRVAQSKTK